MKARILKFAQLLLITVFLLTRFSGLAHAREFGNGPHKHDNKICALVLASEDDPDELGLLPNEISAFSPQTKYFFDRPLDFKNSPVSCAAARVRGPPNL